jgi:preprotein translocase subunit SecF
VEVPADELPPQRKEIAMSTFKTLSAGVVLAIASVTAFAAPGSFRHTDFRQDAPSAQRIDQRQAQQQQQIRQGLASHRLTRNEARQLDREQDVIARAERSAKADGRLSRTERDRIEQMQDRAATNIARELHDRQFRG